MPKKKKKKNNNIEEMEAIKSFNNATEKEKEDFIIFWDTLIFVYLSSMTTTNILPKIKKYQKIFFAHDKDN